MAAAAAAAADVETGGLPVSGKQCTTTTKQARKKPLTSRAERVAYILGVAGVWCLYIGVAHPSIGIAHLFSHWSWPRPYDPVEYTVAIAAVSGLDPLHLHSRRLDLAFNLTLGAASPSTAFGRECLPAGTTVEVSYLRSGVPLATGPAPALCVDAGEHREEGSVVAWGDGVRLPRLVLDSLAADVRRGALEFGVRLSPPVPYCASRPMLFWSTAVDVVSCWAKAGAGPGPCRVDRETVSSRPLPRPGRERDSSSEANLL